MADETSNPILTALAEARRDADRARAEVEDPEERAAFVLRQGAFAAAAGLVAESRSCLEEARRIYQQLGRFDAVARCLLLLAHLSRSSRDGAQAREELDLSLWLFRQAGDVGGQGDALLEHGEVALAEERLDRAEAAFLDARARFREAGLVPRELAALKAAGLSCQFAGRFGEAIRLFEEARELARASQDEVQLLETTLALGGLHSVGGQRQEAARLLHEARELAAARGATEQEIQALVHLAAWHAQRHELPQARELAEQARELAVRSVDVSGYLLAVTVLSQVLRGLGDDVACLDVLFRASNGLADLLGEAGRQPIQELLEVIRREWGELRYRKALERFVAARRAAQVQ